MKLDDLAHLLALTAPDPGKIFGEEDVLSLPESQELQEASSAASLMWPVQSQRGPRAFLQRPVRQGWVWWTDC